MTQTPRTENFERLLDQCYPSGFDQATRTWHSWPEYARTLELETIELKRQLAERDRQLAEAQRDVPEGCTVADARILRKANHELAQVEHRLRLALRFYANGYHMDLSGNPDAWDTVSGEPANYFCDEAGTATIEDGTIAKLALLDGPMDWTGEDGEDQTPPPISGESEHQIAIDAAIQEQKKPRPLCRDCADRNGVCHDGSPCDPKEQKK